MTIGRCLFIPVRSAVGAAIAASLLASAGCGHGKYTTEAINVAETRMSELKSATEWDLARQQHRTGDLRKAMDSVDRSIALNPRVAKSHSLRGRILLEMGQLEAATASFKEALSLDPTFVEAHYYQGIVHETFTDAQGALDEFMAAANLDPSDAQYTLAAGEMLVELGRLDDAERFLEERRKNFEHNAGLRQLLGHIQLLRGDAAGAATRFQEALLLAPDDLQILEDVVQAQMAAGRFAEAESGIRRLMRDPKNAGRSDLKHAQARCLVQTGKPVEARQILMGLTSEEAGRNDLRVWNDLGEVAALLGDMSRVKLVAARLRAIAPDRPEGYTLTAVWQRKEGRLEDALASALTAAEMSGSSAAPWLLAGLILEDLGRSSEASEAYAQALALEPENKAAARLFAAVESIEE